MIHLIVTNKFFEETEEFNKSITGRSKMNFCKLLTENDIYKMGLNRQPT